MVEDEESSDEDQRVVEPVDEVWMLVEKHPCAHEYWTAHDEDDADNPESARAITEWNLDPPGLPHEAKPTLANVARLHQRFKDTFWLVAGDDALEEPAGGTVGGAGAVGVGELGDPATGVGDRVELGIEDEHHVGIDEPSELGLDEPYAAVP